MRTQEKALIGPWLDICAWAFDSAPEVLSYGGDLSGLRFSHPFQPADVIGSIQHYSHAEELLDYVRSLGFDWNAEGRMTTTPTPATFNARLDALGDDAGFHVRYVKVPALTLDMDLWVRSYVNRVIPIHVAGGSFYSQFDRRRETNPPMRWHLTTLVHDLTVHALNYSRIPKPAIADLAKRMRAALSAASGGGALRSTFAKWTAKMGAALKMKPHQALPAGDDAALHALSFFLDNDLNRYCQQIWMLCETPEDFAPFYCASPNLSQLYRVLGIRIEESRAKKGKTATTSTEAESPLTEIHYRLARHLPE